MYALPDARQLSEADLVAELSTTDGLRHLVDGARLAAELAAASRRTAVPRIRALCTTPVLLGSLTAGPSPYCRRCLDTASLQLAVAARHRTNRAYVSRPPGLTVRIARLLGVHRAARSRAAGRHAAATA